MRLSAGRGFLAFQRHRSLTLFQSGSNQVRTTAAPCRSRKTRRHAQPKTFLIRPRSNRRLLRVSARAVEGVRPAAVSHQNHHVFIGNTKGRRTKEPLHLPSISFRNRSEKAASSFLHGCSFAAGYGTECLVGITRGNRSKGRDLLKTH